MNNDDGTPITQTSEAPPPMTFPGGQQAQQVEEPKLEPMLFASDGTGIGIGDLIAITHAKRPNALGSPATLLHVQHYEWALNAAGDKHLIRVHGKPIGKFISTENGAALLHTEEKYYRQAGVAAVEALSIAVDITDDIRVLRIDLAPLWEEQNVESAKDI